MRPNPVFCRYDVISFIALRAGYSIPDVIDTSVYRKNSVSTLATQCDYRENDCILLALRQGETSCVARTIARIDPSGVLGKRIAQLYKSERARNSMEAMYHLRLITPEIWWCYISTPVEISNIKVDHI